MNKVTLNLVLVFLSVVASAQEAIKEIEPLYPMTPVCRDLSGSVNLAFKIDGKGIPYDIAVIEAETEIFNTAAIKTLMKYKFKVGTYVVGDTYNKVLVFKPKNRCHRNA